MERIESETETVYEVGMTVTFMNRLGDAERGVIIGIGVKGAPHIMIQRMDGSITRRPPMDILTFQTY